MSQIYSHLDREELDLSFFIFTTPYVCIDLFFLYFHWNWMITKASSCCFSELPDFTSSKNIGETTIMRYVKCMGAIHQTLLGSGQAPVTPVHRQITHNVYAVVISQAFKLLHGFWYSSIRITKGLKPTSYAVRENGILLQCFEAIFVIQSLFSVLLKRIVHFEIKIWYLSAYPKGIQDVGVFFSSVDPILMF